MVSVSTAVVYLLYRPFPEWWYLRFLLPALAAMTTVACASVAWSVVAASGRRSFTSAVLVIVLAAALGGFQLNAARERGVSDLQRLERRFRTTGDQVRERLPANAVFITVWESGTVRYHANREAILWDALAPSSLDRAIAWMMCQAPSVDCRSNDHRLASVRRPPPILGVHDVVPVHSACAVVPVIRTLQAPSETRCDCRLANARARVGSSTDGQTARAAAAFKVL